MKRGKRTLVATVVAAGVLALPSAFGFWTAGGTGAGQGATNPGLAIEITPGTPSDTLHPGGTSSVAATLTNPNTYVAHIDALALDVAEGTGGYAVDAGHAGCDVSALSFTTQDNAAAGWDVPARAGGIDGELDVDLEDALALTVAATNLCQGATFTVYLEVTS